MKKLFYTTMIVFAVVSACGVAYVSGFNKGYRTGYVERSNSMIQVDYLSGESVDSIQFVSLNGK